MKTAVVLTTILACLGGSALMSQPKPPAAPVYASYIPATAGPWLSEADQIFDASTIFAYIDGAGEVYRSYNMRRLVARRFHKDGKPDIVVDAFDMGSSADAFGVFTHDLDGEEAGIGQGSRYKSGLLTFWKDRYFLSVYTEEETAETRALVLELGRAIAAAVPGEGAKPALLRLLPPAGLEAGSVRFFHNHSILNYHYFVAAEDVLLLGQTADAVLADYDRTAAGRSRLLVVAYADDATAARAGRSFAAACLPGSRDGTAARTENGRWRVLRVQGRYAAVVFDAATEDEARARLEEAAALMAGISQGGRH